LLTNRVGLVSGRCITHLGDAARSETQEIGEHEKTEIAGIGATGGVLKYTIFVTRECNLNCCYCYLDKEPGTAMTRATADRVVDFIYQHASPDERISIGFFGGEPLLEPVLLGDVATMIEDHPDFDPFRVEMAVGIACPHLARPDRTDP